MKNTRRSKWLIIAFGLGLVLLILGLRRFMDRTPAVRSSELSRQPLKPQVSSNALAVKHQSTTERALVSSEGPETVNPQIEKPAAGDAAPAPLHLDRSGKTPEQHLQTLKQLHDEFQSTCVRRGGTSRGEVLRSVWSLTAQSVAAIMRAQGRAQYEPDSEDGFKIIASGDQWSFVSGAAKFEFPKGEFMAYDFIARRMEARPSRLNELPVFEESELLEYEMLFEAAVASLRSSR